MDSGMKSPGMKQSLSDIGPLPSLGRSTEHVPQEVHREMREAAVPWKLLK